jgi:TatD DNase family protein
MHALQDQAPAFFFPMMGLHPCSVKPGFEEVLEKMETALQQTKYYGIGETGIDLHWDVTYLDLQKISLQIQIDWAKKYHLPIILHARNSLDIVIDMIEKNADDSLRGIFHCFGGTLEQASRIAAIPHFKMGIGGVITYKKAGLFELLPEIDIQKLVLETDSPYLPPVPYRGKRNESSYTTIIAQQLAEAKSISLREVAEITNKNTKEVFGLN